MLSPKLSRYAVFKLLTTFFLNSRKEEGASNSENIEDFRKSKERITGKTVKVISSH